MRKRIVLFFLFAGIFGSICFATGDSTHYLTPHDTIFLKTDYYGEKLFEHTLEKKQTLYSLSKFYGISLEELYFYNPDLETGNTSLGQVVNVPIPNRAILRMPKNAMNPKHFVPVYYIAKRGETLYRISKNYFKLPVDTLLSWNGLNGHQLKVGQKLHVGWMSLGGIPDTLRYFSHPLLKRSHELLQEYRQGGTSRVQQVQRGAAFWQKLQGHDSVELFALHRHAQPGSVISVSNPMTRRTIFVKVLGDIPDAAYRDNIITVLSTAAAKLLGARDPKFYVEVKYWK